MCSSFDEMVKNFDKVIRQDLKRTGGSKITDFDRELMRRVLTSYAKRNFDVGYCQGFNFISYYLFQIGFSEEEMFWMMCRIFDHIMPPNYYVQMIPVMSDLEFFDILLMEKEKSLWQELKSKKIDLNFVLIPNFITLFTNLDNFEVY